MINLIEEKVNRGHTRENPVIKGRSVFNGRVQRGLYLKENGARKEEKLTPQTSAPTNAQNRILNTWKQGTSLTVFRVSCDAIYSN
jgi:hypothetical protein